MISLLLAAAVLGAPGTLPLRLGAERPAHIRTSAAGDRMRSLPVPGWRRGPVRAPVVVRVGLDAPRQTIEGIGGSLTEATAFVLAHRGAAERAELLDACFGPEGADLTLARTPIGSCDFTVHGRYDYAPVEGDTALAAFSLAPDRAGFAGAADPAYDVLPLLHDAFARQPALRLVGSAWTAPPWMKANGAYFDKGVAGGRLRPDQRATYARYLARWVRELTALGIPVWAVTPVNEPLGVGGQWESMEMGPDEARDVIRDHLGPALAPLGVRILQYDQNREPIALDYARRVFEDSACAARVHG
ncbi:MAG: glycoside hydrolase family 30 protein, partial [bacterium]